MLDYLLTNINYIVAQAYKPKRQCDLISSQPASPIYMTCFFEISPTWTSKYLSRLFPVSPDFAVIQQYKTRLVHQTSFKYLFVFLVNTTSEKIYENYKNPSELFLSKYYYWFNFSLYFNYLNNLYIIHMLKWQICYFHHIFTHIY